MTQSNRKSTIEMIRADVTTPNHIKALLESLEPQDPCPPELVKWMGQIFTEGRKRAHSDDDTIEWINTYATSRKWARTQIQNAINECISKHGYKK